MPQTMLDTHIHLWPSTALAPTNHRWMTPGHQLALQHGISEYRAATQLSSPNQPSGFVYVETDRFLPSEFPSAMFTGSGEERRTSMREWANEPLEELKFLRRVVEDQPHGGDGFQVGDGDLMKGAVAWAPFQLSSDLFNLYLDLAEETAGPQLWKRIVGFRYLLQGIRQEADLRRLVLSEDWLQNLLRLRQGREGKGWAFDVGVDTHGGGKWQVEVAADMIETVRNVEGDGSSGHVRFVLNHLCKPDLSNHASPHPSLADYAYQYALTRMAAKPLVYMKLSGVFNEFYPSPTPVTSAELNQALQRPLGNIFPLFKNRIMFGSDWPVCNLGGPLGENSWGLWRQVVEDRLQNAGLSDEEKEQIWWKAGCEAYRIEM